MAGCLGHEWGTESNMTSDVRASPGDTSGSGDQARRGLRHDHLDTRVSFTIVTDDGHTSRIAGMQYSFIGPPLGGPR